MAKVPAFAKAFAGRWRIVEMDTWDNDVLDLVEEAHLTFTGASGGKIVFGALQGFVDVRLRARMGQLRNRRTADGPLLHSPGRRVRLRLRTHLTSSAAC